MGLLESFGPVVSVCYSKGVQGEISVFVTPWFWLRSTIKRRQWRKKRGEYREFTTYLDYPPLGALSKGIRLCCDHCMRIKDVGTEVHSSPTVCGDTTWIRFGVMWCDDGLYPMFVCFTLWSTSQRVNVYVLLTPPFVSNGHKYKPKHTRSSISVCG